MDTIISILCAIVLGFFYFLPTIIAQCSKKKNVGAIMILNLFLGWTLIGWVIALIWASIYEKN